MMLAQILKIAGAVFLAVILATIIDPYLRLSDSVIILSINGILPALWLLFIWGATGRFWAGVIFEVILLGLLRYANYVKFRYLDANLVYADITVIGKLMADPSLILGFLQPTPKKIVAVVITLFFAVLFLFVSRRIGKAPGKWRITYVFTAMIVFGAICVTHVPAYIPSLNWEVFTQSVGAERVGVVGNILLGRMSTRDIARAPDIGAIRDFWNEPLVKKAQKSMSTGLVDIHPDIVIIQSESLFEPAQLCGFPDEPILKRVAKEKPALPGNLRVPVFGGRTLQTEFEVLTGAPIYFYPGSMFAYYELIKHPINAMPQALSKLGYETTIIHPGGRGFWNRDTVMPEMGFESFQDVKSFLWPREFSDRHQVDDLTLMQAVLAVLDTTAKPAFVMAISINNHGPWGGAPAYPYSVKLPSTLQGRAREQLADYVVNAIKADQAYGFLLDALARRGRPAIVMIYGDHLPGLADVYEHLCFKDRKPPIDHMPPYRVWSNFPIPRPPDITYAYLLQGWLLHAAGLPLKGQLLANALTGYVLQNTAISSEGRNRVVNEYANIAAENVRESSVSRTNLPSRVFINGDQALGVLNTYRSSMEGGDVGQVKIVDDQMIFMPMDDRGVGINFNLGSGFSRITFRPYSKCYAEGRQSLSEMIIKADDRLIYKAKIGRNLFRLVNMNVSGVKKLSMRAETTAGAACKPVYVKVAQMQCYSSDCSKPESQEQTNDVTPLRILSSDPAMEDIDELRRLKNFHFNGDDVEH